MTRHAEIHARLTAPGSPLETVEVPIGGVPTITWRNADPHLVAMLERTRSYGDRTFLVHGEERITFDEHADRVAGLARTLVQDYGIAKGDRVALAMRNYPEWPMAFFAIAATGAIVVPLNAWWTGPELLFALRDSGARALIADSERLARIGDPGMPVLVARPDRELPAGARDLAGLPVGGALPQVELAPDDDATIFYTSGTTGEPKGALGSHRGICSAAMNSQFAAASAALAGGASLSDFLGSPGVVPGARLLVVPFFHVTGCHTVLIPAVTAGAAIVLMHRWDASEALRLIERERVVGLIGVPATAIELLEHPDRDRYDLSSLALLGLGGSPSPSGLVGRATQALPGLAMSNGYGLTEISGICATNSGADYLAHPDSVGTPNPMCAVRLVDENGAEVATGGTGELCIKGATVFTGYWGRPDATAEAIVDGWFHTGDIARFDDEGFVYLVDRAKDMLLRGGENVYSAEVENAIQGHTSVREVAVIGVPHEVLGEEVGAVVRLVPGAALSADELRDHLTGRLARFKIPEHVWFAEEELPRNAAGKVLKTTLREQFT